MANFSQYLQNQLLGVTLLGSPFTALTTTWYALATTIASDGDFFTEVTTGLGYGRQPLISGTDWSDITSVPNTSLVNSATISFSPATTPWGTVAHFAIFDAETIGAGNMLYWGDFATPRVVQTTDDPEIQAGLLTIRLD